MDEEKALLLKTSGSAGIGAFRGEITDIFRIWKWKDYFIARESTAFEKQT